MGMFEDYADIDAEMDFSIANGAYPMMITDSKIIEHHKKPGVEQWQITYKVSPDVDDFGGRTVSEFFDLDPELSDDRKVWITRRLISLGFTEPEDRRSFEPGSVEGVDVTVTVVNKKVGDNTYTNVKKVVLGADVDSFADSAF